MSKNIDAILGIASPDTAPRRPAIHGKSDHPLYGVKGLLFFGVVMNMYVAPVLFLLMLLFTWGGISEVAGRYPGTIAVGLYSTLFGSYLVVRGVLVARGFRDLRPRSVQNAKALLWLSVLYVLIGIPVTFMSGIRPEALIPGIVKGVLMKAVGFAVLFTYLNVSKRVAVTFPDWKDE
jgi:hypothetical protein